MYAVHVQLGTGCLSTPANFVILARFPISRDLLTANHAMQACLPHSMECRHVNSVQLVNMMVRATMPLKMAHARLELQLALLALLVLIPVSLPQHLPQLVAYVWLENFR